MPTHDKITIQTSSGPVEHSVVSRKEWLASRTALLKKEKEFSRLQDQIAKERRDLPWVKVDKEYLFDTLGGQRSLADLFDGRRQLFVYHFMFAPEWNQGCAHCSFWADHYDGVGIHLKQRDVTLIVISRAPLANIEAFKKRMGWKFTWVSSFQNTFNYDFNASFTPEENQKGTAFFNYKVGDAGASDREGASIFYRDDHGGVYHTYSCYARGIDALNGTYQFLDRVPKGRDEDGFESPQSWVRHHDRYSG